MVGATWQAAPPQPQGLPGARSLSQGLLRRPSTSAQASRGETLFTVPAWREWTVVPPDHVGLSGAEGAQLRAPATWRQSFGQRPSGWKPECPPFPVIQSTSCPYVGCQSLAAPIVATGAPGSQSHSVVAQVPALKPVTLDLCPLPACRPNTWL